MKNLKPALVSTGVNYEYIVGRDELFPTEDKSILPSTAAMHWCMSACRVNRIFSKEDLSEFLFRLPIALDALEVLESWFGYDELFTYQRSGKRYAFSVDDIFRHYGIEICDSLENLSARDTFLDVTLQTNIIRSTKFIGLLGGIQVLPVDINKNFETDERIIKVADDSDVPLISDKHISDATYFASDVMKLAPSNLFDNQGRFQAKYDEIELRKKEIASIPKFDLSKIPSELRVKCMALMFDPKWVESCQGREDEDYQEYEEQYIYLAWLFANDLMGANDYGLPEPLEGVELEFDDYELEDGGWNLEITYDDFNIKEVEPLLKGVLF